MEIKPKILFAEDDTSLGFVVADQLERDGYTVTHVQDGKEAEKVFKKETFHLCVLDVMMPKKDGFTLAKYIRSVNRDIPILFLTAKTMTEDKVKGFEIGGDDYLTKPFSADELRVRVKALLKRVDIGGDSEFAHIIRLGKYEYDVKNYELRSASFEQKLTKKEAQILRLLASRENEVIPRETILTEVWGKNDYFVGRSLDVFITKLRKYLSSDELVEIKNIHGIGFKLMVKEN